MARSLDFDTLIAQALDATLNDADLPTMIRGVDRDVARAEALARLRAPEIDPFSASVLARALIALGLEPVLARVLDLAADPAIAESARVACFHALISLPMPLLLNTAAENPRWLVAIEHLALFSAIVAAHESSEAIDTLCIMVRQTSARDRVAYVERVESMRRNIGVAASRLYASMLADAEIANDDGARAVLLAAVVSEADEDGSALLQRLRAKASKKLRAPFQVALLKLETAKLGGAAASTAAANVRAWSTQPDGQGAVAVVFALSNPDGTSTLVDLCFRLTRDLRQGFVVPRATEREVLELVRDLGAGSLEVISASPGELATIIDEAQASHRAMKVRMPRECESPLRSITKVPRAPLPEVAPAPTVKMARMAEILRTPRHIAWFYDDDDLRTNVRRVDLDDGDAVLEALEASPMRTRVASMARFMVHYAHWSGDAKLASEWAAIAAEVARDFANSSCARAMLHASGIMDTGGAGLGDGKHRIADYGVEGMLIPFAELFPEVAAVETYTMSLRGHRSIPDGEYLMVETFCTARSCDCERVTFVVVDTRTLKKELRVGYAFTPAAAKRFYGNQFELDPTGSRPPWADAMMKMMQERMKSDPAWRTTVMRHYEMSRTL